MAKTVNDRGQITIDRDIRKKLGIEPGMVAYQRVVDGRLEVIFLPAPHSDSLFGALSHLVLPGTTPVDDDGIEEAVMEAVAEKHARD